MTDTGRCETGGCIAVTYEADRVHITETERPDETITTSRTNWDRFVASIEAPLRAEIDRLTDINGKLALTIRACPEGHHDANLAHARAERDQLRAEVERLKANQQPDAGGHDPVAVAVPYDC